MKKLFLTTILVSFFFSLCFINPIKAENQALPVIVTIEKVNDYYLYCFTNTVVLHEITILSKTITDVAQVDITLFNFTATNIVNLQGSGVQYTYIEPDLVFSSINEFDFIIKFINKALLPIIIIN